jgi:hypothetical protein
VGERDSPVRSKTVLILNKDWLGVGDRQVSWLR